MQSTYDQFVNLKNKGIYDIFAFYGNQEPYTEKIRSYVFV